VFVTSSTYGTTLQPLEAADDNCNLAARAAQLPGTYRAWLATANVPAPDRLQGARGWIRVDGVPFADTIADIVNGRIFNPPRVDEYGNDLGATDSWQVMTGTNSDGIDVPGQDCEGWTNSAASVYQAVGDLRATTQIWTSGGAVQCNETVRMYCFGVDKQQPLTTTSVAGKRAFISDGSFRASGGLSAADQECADEAAASLLSGTFKALLATSTASAASRFTSSPSTIWVRVDGMPLNAPGTDIMDGGQLLTPLNVSSTRAYVGNVGVYTGASTPREVPMVSSSCDDWQQPSTADLVIIGAVTHTVSWFREFASPCNLFSSGQVRIYCLEQ
jgi:hypothetical protein